MKLGPLHVEVGSMKIGRWGIPDGLHVWLGRRGLHAFWHHSPYQRRITFDYAES